MASKHFDVSIFTFPSEFSSTGSQKAGRSSAQLKYATQEKDEVAKHFWDRLSYVCQSVPIKDNFYLSLFIRGHRGYNPLEKPYFCPSYFREEAFYQLKVGDKNPLTIHKLILQGLVDRIMIHTGTVETYLAQSDATFSKVICII